MSFKVYNNFIISFLIILVFVSCNNESNFPLFYNLEPNEFNQKLIADNGTSKYARSGNFGAEISKSNPFGLSFNFENLKKGNQILISVWQKTGFSNGYLKLIDQQTQQLLASVKTDEFSHAEWRLVSMNYILEKDIKNIKFFIHNPKNIPAYYDDLKIDVIKQPKKINLTKENIDILLKQKDLDLLKKFRAIALKKGIISPSLKKYFNAIMIYRNKEIPIKIRLKGDWIDHLKSDKWSFRIKINGEFNFKGIKKFSIQHPKTRSFLKEWIIHKIFKEEGVLTTRYGFISASLNGKNLGIYAFEEHFSEELIKYYNKQNAPILKFNEDGLWETRWGNPKNKIAYPYLESAKIVPFSKKNVFASKELSELFDYGRSSMEKYRSNYTNLDSIFNIKKTALMYALNDLGSVRHSYHWHNQRTYINPADKKLEFIAYDCYAGIDEGIEDTIYGYSSSNSFCSYNQYLSKQFFNNKDFTLYYKNYLKKVSSKKYVNDLIKKYQTASDSLLKILYTEFPFYTFNLNYLSQNAQNIRNMLIQYDTNYSFYLVPPKYNYKDIGNNYFPSIGLKVKYKELDTTKILKLKNFHLDTVFVIGYGNKKNQMEKFNTPLLLEGYKNGIDNKEIFIKENFKFLFIRPVNLKDTLKISIDK